MTSPSAPERILKQTRWCTARRQENAVLLYNARTDELHLIPEDAYYVLQLCDGLHTVGEITDLVCEGAKADESDVKGYLTAFLDGLVDRGILEPCSYE
jgi:hypothetical protein